MEQRLFDVQYVSPDNLLYKNPYVCLSSSSSAACCCCYLVCKGLRGRDLHRFVRLDELIKNPSRSFFPSASISIYSKIKITLIESHNKNSNIRAQMKRYGKHKKILSNRFRNLTDGFSKDLHFLWGHWHKAHLRFIVVGLISGILVGHYPRTLFLLL